MSEFNRFISAEISEDGKIVKLVYRHQYAPPGVYYVGLAGDTHWMLPEHVATNVRAVEYFDEDHLPDDDWEQRVDEHVSAIMAESRAKSDRLRSALEEGLQ